jgi:hypothetical protein
MTPEVHETEAASAGRPRWRAAAEVALIFLVFFVHAGWPVPDVNEAHYLAKAKHYWNPEWASGDFFLGTADAHEMFYFAFGWVTLWLSLTATAWTGRVLIWLLLAWAWRRLSMALIDGWLYSVLSAAVFVALLDRFHMAGEWVVGGVEGKGFAYVFVLLGIERLVRDRWGTALILFGAAAAFHVIVGGWAVVATIIAWLLSVQRPPLSRLVLPAMAGGLLSLGGLWPALELTRGVDAATVSEANRLYVYERLEHHLLPEDLPTRFIVRHLILVVVLAALSFVAPLDASWNRLRAFVAAAVGIAAVGFLLSLLIWWQPDLAANLLRYYWFRLSDAMVPLGVALFAAAILLRWQIARSRWFVGGLVAALLVSGWHLGDTVRFRLTYLTPRADCTLPRVNIRDWREVARWAAQETPPGTVFIVPRLSQTFRWYSGRGEVVTRKDLPQDAESIVAWWQRQLDVYGPEAVRQPADTLGQLGADHLRSVGAKYGATYMVTLPNPQLDLPRVGPITETVAVYQLLPLREVSSPQLPSATASPSPAGAEP